MKVYKVVRVEDGKLKSAVGRREYSSSSPVANLIYHPDKTTKPRFGKIFAFDSVEAAQRFTPMWPKTEVWEAETPDAKPILEIASDGFGCLDRFKKFWAGKTTVETMVAPAGTVICSELKLIRKVE